MVRVASVELVGLALAVPARAVDDELSGRWVCKTEFLTVTTVLLPDGRYFAEIKVGDAVVPERGKYSAQGGTITFDPHGEKAMTYPYRLTGDTLEVTTPEVGRMLYTRVNTAKEVAAEAAKADEAKAKEDAGWRKRLETAVMAKQPPHVAVGDVPADENFEKVFDKPTVFTKPQLYLRRGSEEYVYEGGNPPGTFRTYFNWHFLPTGRVYVDATTYTGGVALPKALQGPNGTYYVSGKSEVRKFGRYKIEKDETIVIEMDDGEKADTKLFDGRRNMSWGKSIYGNVIWELEALERMKQKR